MRLGFSSISYPEASPADLARAAEEYGYEGVELYSLDGRFLDADQLWQRRGEIARALGDLPLICVNAGTTLFADHVEQREYNERTVVTTLQAASDLGCPRAKVFGGDLPPDSDLGSVFDSIAEAIERVLIHANALGVELVIETHDGFCRGQEVAQLLERVPDPGFGVLWDMHHPWRKGEAPEQTHHHVGTRVRHVHVKDARRAGDGWLYTLPGDGEVPIREVLGLLERDGFDGWVSLDWEKFWHPEIADPHVALPRYREWLVACLRDLSPAAG